MGIFNNRELASATLIALVLLWTCYKNETFFPLLKTAAKSLFLHAVFITIISLLVYISLIAFVLYSFDIWNFEQIKNTAMWFVFVGFAQLLNATNIDDPKLYLRSSLSAQVKIIVLLQFLVAFHSYSFVVELILITITSLLAGCSAFSQNKPEYNQANKICNFLLVAIGIFLLCHSLLTIYQEPSKFFTIDNFRNFLVPILLSVSVLPYIFCFYHFLAYERAFTKTRIYTSSKSLQRYAKLQSFIVFRGQHKQIHEWLLYSCTAEFESKETILASINNFKNQQCAPTV
ncbi:hypothetical protein SOPP22_14215 [Shewanella sp. OPT22]|nr:hypothetical protein SOPP22_14215 [Shewanella sp. OPT22]